MFKKLSKMMNYAFDVAQEHIVEFLMEVFKGVTGEFIEKHEKTLKKAVEIVEEVAEFISEKEAAGEIQLTKDIRASWGIDIEEKEVSLILKGGRDKSRAKHEIAYNWITKELGTNKVLDHAIDLGINAIVAEMHE